jgi:hypothetical protein
MATTLEEGMDDMRENDVSGFKSTVGSYIIA